MTLGSRSAFGTSPRGREFSLQEARSWRRGEEASFSPGWAYRGGEFSMRFARCGPPRAGVHVQQTGKIHWRPEYLIDGASVKEVLRLRFKAEFSSTHRSTSTATTATSEDAFFRRSHVVCMLGRRIRTHRAQRHGRPAEKLSSKEREGVTRSCFVKKK